MTTATKMRRDMPADEAVETAKPDVLAGLSDDLLEIIGSTESMQRQRRLMEAYKLAETNLLTDDDFQDSGEKNRDGTPRRFKTRAAWRKLARQFRISWTVDSVEGHWTKPEDGEIRHYHARSVVTATAPWGQSVQEVGGCATEESRFHYKSGGVNHKARMKAMHDCEATAVTRAVNRAISDLIAAGEVSAEEVEMGGGSNNDEARAATARLLTVIANPLIRPSEREKVLRQIEDGLSASEADALFTEAQAVIDRRGNPEREPGSDDV